MDPLTGLNGGKSKPSQNRFRVDSMDEEDLYTDAISDVVSYTEVEGDQADCIQKNDSKSAADISAIQSCYTETDDMSSIPPPPPNYPPPKTRSYLGTLGSLLAKSKSVEEGEDEDAEAQDVSSRSPRTEDNVMAALAVTTAPTLESADADDESTAEAEDSEEDNINDTTSDVENNNKNRGEEDECEEIELTLPESLSRMDNSQKSSGKKGPKTLFASSKKLGEQRSRRISTCQVITIVVLLAIIGVFLGLGLTRNKEAEQVSAANSGGGTADEDTNNDSEFDFDNIAPEEEDDVDPESTTTTAPSPINVTPEPAITTSAPTAPENTTEAPTLAPVSMAPTQCMDLIQSVQTCYNVEDEIRIQFENCVPLEDDWIGIYLADPDRDLADVDEPIDWLWACGTQDCEEPVAEGIVPFNVDVELDEGTYVTYLIRSQPDDGRPYPAYAESVEFTISSAGCI